MGRRRSVINLFERQADNLIPHGTRIGQVVYSSRLSGRDPDTGLVPADPEAQAAALFRNIARLMELAGGTTDDIIRMNVYL